MNDIVKTILLTTVTGVPSALAMGWTHELTKSKNLSFIARYIIGSSSCLTALSISLWFMTENWLLIAMAWSIWTITGAAVWFAHHNDKIQAKKRELREEKEILNGEPNYSNYK